MKKHLRAASTVSLMVILAVFLSLLVSCEDIMGVKLNIVNKTSEPFEVKLLHIASDNTELLFNIPANTTVTQKITPGNYRLWSRVYHGLVPIGAQETQWIEAARRFYDDGIEKTETINNSGGLL